MKNCTSFKKQLIAYLHGELGERDRLTVEVHLDGCAACRAALEAQRATLELLGTALETASAPEKLTARRTLPHRVSVRQSTFADYWYSPKLRAALVTGTVCSVLFLISVSFVAVKVIVKEEASFAAKTVTRPKMPAKKLQVPVDVKKRKPKPKLRKRIVSKGVDSYESEVKMPEITGVKGGLGNMGGNSLTSLGFDLKGGSVFVVEDAVARSYGFDDNGKATLLENGGVRAEPMAEVATTWSAGRPVRSTNLERSNEPLGISAGLASSGRDSSFAVSSRVVVGYSPEKVPKMPLKKLSVKMDKASKPKSTAKITAKVASLDLHDIQFPDLSSSGIGAGLGGVSDESMVDADAALVSQLVWRGAELRADDLFASADKSDALEIRVDHLKSLSIKEPVPERLSQRKPAGFNPYVLAAENAFSTFSIDVDTAAYGLARQQLFAGGLPVPETVRTEEFINSFDYDYRPPAGKQTFAVHSEMAPSPFRTGMDLLKVGIKGYRIGRDNHRGAVLTLVIDTSGSMSTPERMGLVKKSLALLLDGLGPEDEVALVQFGGEARLVLEHTPLVQKAELLKAIAKLQPGGPTQFDAGLELGYAMATAGFKAGASNRIIIMSDGVANVGELDPEAMLQKVGEHRRKGIYLSVLGFGAGTYDDDLMERLANRGDGMYAYIDTLDEARRLLVDQLAATLHVIASDVKIQIEFNPDRVLRYRQLGYENRQLTKEQFRDDTVDAGEVGSGQAVTALYDLELNPNSESRDPIAMVYVRYRRADTGAIEEISSRVTDSVRRKRFADAAARFQLAACTAEFAERLRRSPYADGTEMVDILGKLQPVAAELDLDAQVQELLRLILIADGLGK